MQSGDQQQTAQLASSIGTSADEDKPNAKRRKHFGVRYGAPVAASQLALHARAAEPRQKQPINHDQVQRVKAEAQLHGRKFHLDTTSCVPPDVDQLFISQPWTVPEMMTEKKKLSDTKNLLDCKDIK